jgi:hypothetical protein
MNLVQIHSKGYAKHLMIENMYVHVKNCDSFSFPYLPTCAYILCVLYYEQMNNKK